MYRHLNFDQVTSKPCVYIRKHSKSIITTMKKGRVNIMYVIARACGASGALLLVLSRYAIINVKGPWEIGRGETSKAAIIMLYRISVHATIIGRHSTACIEGMYVCAGRVIMTIM